MTMVSGDSKTRCIFYDLETSDQNPIGQIVNLCFIVTDTEFNILDEFSREIRISRLQLPSAGAILANRTDVIEHQRAAQYTEPQALHELWEFLERQFKEARSSLIIGYNNLGFDQNFLRTSFIRNGLNPYYQKSVTEADLYHLTQYLSITNADFPRPKSKKIRKDGKSRLSLSLEGITTALGLLKGQQTHHSRDDVLLTIELAKEYKKRFSTSIIGFNPYQAGEFHPHNQKKKLRGSVIYKDDPQYDHDLPELRIRTPHMFLDCNYRYSIWVDLSAFEKGYKSLRMSKINLSTFFTDQIPIADEKIQELSKKALEVFEQVNIDNYFTQTTCDIEQFIYRIDFDHINKLNNAIWNGQKGELSLEDAKKVLGRFQLANYKINGKQDDVFWNRLKDYAMYRYGGQLRMDRGGDLEDGILKREPRKQTHPTFNDQLMQIEKLSKDAKVEDLSLLSSLKKFYYESDIYKAAGKDLEKIPVQAEDISLNNKDLVSKDELMHGSTEDSTIEVGVTDELPETATS